MQGPQDRDSVLISLGSLGVWGRIVGALVA